MITRRLLMTADTVGGVWTYALELSRALAPYGYGVTLATLGSPLTPAQREEVALVPSIDVVESHYKLEWMEDPWQDVEEAGQWLRWLEDLVQPDLIHLNSYVHGSLDWRAPVVVVGHSCVVSWWRAVYGGDPPETWRRYREEVACGLHAADLVIAPSATMLTGLRENYGSLREPRVIPNGRDKASRASIRKESIVLMAGRLWDQAKNFETLRRAAQLVAWPVCVAGDSRGCNLGNCIGLGRLASSDLAAQYSRASIYTLPALYEPFGLSVLEAALAGCALVLGDIRSLRENWDDAAIFVPPDDEKALAAAINTLIAQPRRLAELRAAAEGRALQFTAQRMGAAYVLAYREAAALASRQQVCAS